MNQTRHGDIEEGRIFGVAHLPVTPIVRFRKRARLWRGGESAWATEHNYVVEVAVEGNPDPVTGMILDLKRLKEILDDKVINIYDHRLLNREVSPFDEIVPTVENIAIDIWNRLAPSIQGLARLYSVRVHETGELFVEYRGEP